MRNRAHPQSEMEERYEAAYEQWCEIHDHDPYSPHAARHYAAIQEEAGMEYQQYLEDNGSN